MRSVLVEQMRELERRVMAECEVTGEQLMDRAGFGVADAVQRLADETDTDGLSVLLVAGRGNNGGDAFAAARHLKAMGYRPTVWLAGEEKQVQGDALQHLSRMKAEDIPLEEVTTAADWEDAAANSPGTDFIVDGLLGTGSRGPARGPVASAIRFVNALSDEGRVVSIDVPSGLDADTGRSEGDCVQADLTVTMGLPKRGLLAQDAIEWVGRLEVADIGIPDDFMQALPMDTDREFIDLSDLRPLWPRRPRRAHKGTFGHALLLGGSTRYAGAIVMACRAAVRSGAGRVTALVPSSLVSLVVGAAPEAIVMGVPETPQGALSYEWWKAWKESLGEFSSVMIGPGLTCEESSRQLVRQVLRDCRVPLVLDADALNVQERRPSWVDAASCPVIITPHPGEMARLMNTTTETIQLDRYAAAREAAMRMKCTVVLKGAGTLVTAPGKPLCLNLTGNPGMAKGGSGDVLAGLLAGLLAQGIDPFDAARLAVYLHGRAGDAVAGRRSQAGLTACDIAQELPFAFRDLTLR